jgi:maltooligosyltrehalose trehalohydrolase
MSAQWDDDVHHAVHVALTGESQGYYGDFAKPGVLAKTLRDVFLHDGRGLRSWSHVGCHGRPVRAPPGTVRRVSPDP